MICSDLLRFDEPDLLKASSGLGRSKILFYPQGRDSVEIICEASHALGGTCGVVI